MRSLRDVYECTHRFRKVTGSVNEPKSNNPVTNQCVFRNLCVKEAVVLLVLWWLLNDQGFLEFSLEFFSYSWKGFACKIPSMSSHYVVLLVF